MTAELKRDSSGDLQAGFFYDLLIMDELGQSLLRREERDGTISVFSPDDEQNIHVEVVYDRTEFKYECPLDHRHESGVKISSWHADVYVGKQVGRFVPDHASHRVVVSNEFADLLGQQKFVGLTFEVVPIHINQSNLASPQFLAINFSDAVGFRRPTIFPDDANYCRFCRFGPVLCPVCHFRWWNCPECKQEVFVTEKRFGGADDRRIVIRPMRAPRVMEMHRWKGEDFVSNSVSRKVVDFLVSIKASPFIARPCLVDMDSANQSQKALLEELRADHTSE